ncbi:MAG: hypothetical protein M1835_007336 [Candelina submexicana]|nr:MAG: hypothetical protein M1835_007336 [Candelina submexicana]
MQALRRHVVGLFALGTLLFLCTFFAIGIHQQAVETLSGLARDVAVAKPLTTDSQLHKRAANNALSFAFKWEWVPFLKAGSYPISSLSGRLTDDILSYNSPRMAGARLALAQYDQSSTESVTSDEDKDTTSLLSGSLEAVACYTCKNKPSAKDVLTISTNVSKADSSAFSSLPSNYLSNTPSATSPFSSCSTCSYGHTRSAVASFPPGPTDPPPSPTNFYMLYTSPPAPSSDGSSYNPVSFYMIYTPSSANVSSVTTHVFSAATSLPSGDLAGATCPLQNLTTRISWINVPATTVTSVVTETWHRTVFLCNTTYPAPATTNTVTASITVTVEKSVVPINCSNISSDPSTASLGYSAPHNSTNVNSRPISETYSSLAPATSNTTLPHSFSSSTLSSAAYFEILSTTTPTTHLTASYSTASSVTISINEASSPILAYPMPTPSGMLECADGSYAKSAHYCPGGLMYPPTSSSPSIDWPAFTPSMLQWGPSTSTPLKVYIREEGDGEIEPTADANEPAGQAPVRNVHATMFRRWRTHHYH